MWFPVTGWAIESVHSPAASVNLGHLAGQGDDKPLSISMDEVRLKTGK
jgi:hypothetical protein